MRTIDERLMSNDSPIIVALDDDDVERALTLASKLDPSQCSVKVGKALFTRDGQSVLAALAELGHRVFLDLKFHDIPATVAGAIKAATAKHVWMVNVHASGGASMLSAAREAMTNAHERPLLIGVTVLTSMDEATLRALGCKRTLAQQVAYLTELSMQSGLDGVVCSAHEVSAVKAAFPAAVTVTPGIRPTWAGNDDQHRVMTPKQAIANGSDYLVIGRPITHASSPQQALDRILEELK